MTSNPDKLDLAISMVREANETVFFADEFLFIKKFINRKRLILVSEKHLFYFSKKEGNLKRFNIHKLNGISIDNKQIILDFQYPKQIKIVASKESEESYEKLFKALILSIQHLSSNFELERLNFNFDPTFSSKFSSLIPLTSLPSFYGSFCRFDLSLEEFFYQPDQLDEIKIRFFMLFHRKLADIPSFIEGDKASKLLLEFLPICPSAKYLSIKQFGDKNIFRFLSSYINNLSTIESISIDGSVNTASDDISFSNFINQMKTNLKSKMVGLSFLNSQFTNDHLNVLQDFIKSKNIQAIEFHNSFANKTVFSHFVSHFLPSISQCNDFTSLFLEDIESVDFGELYKNLPPQIKSLSIVNCDVAINQICETIKTGSNIKVLNLSYNTIGAYQNFTRKDFKFSIPDFLTVLTLDYVTFPFGSLIPFLQSLFTEIRNDSDISIIHMIASGADLEKLDEMFQLLADDIQKKKINFAKIRSLKWDFNPISPNFISYLNLQSNLTCLSISGCYSPSDKAGFNEFCDFISKSKSLKKLMCRRFDQISLETLTPQLLGAVLSSNIDFLDIQSSKGGSACYKPLQDFLTKIENDQNSQNNQNIFKCLIYDGLEPEKKEDLIDFITFIKQHGFSTKCSFPINDIEYLYKQRKINFVDVQEIISLCMLEAKNDYCRPFKVFYKENQCCYQFYFKDECESIRINNDKNNENNNDDHSFDETNPNFFFGDFFEEINRKNYSKHLKCIFSFYSDDENLCKNQKLKNIPKTEKHQNTKSSNWPKKFVSNDDVFHITSQNEEIENDDFLSKFSLPSDQAPTNESPLSQTPTKESPVVQTPKSNQNLNIKPTPVKKLTVSDDLYSEGDYDDDGSYDEEKIQVAKPKLDLKPKSPISPVRPNLAVNRGKMQISPKKTAVQPKRIVTPTLIDNSDDYSYSYSD